MESKESLTKQVLTHHLAAFGNNDLDEIIKDYTEESELLTPVGLFRGLAAISKFFKEFFFVIPIGSAFEMKQLTITRNIGYIVWASESAGTKIPLGTDTFILESDKIRFHTVADYRVTK